MNINRFFAESARLVAGLFVLALGVDAVDASTLGLSLNGSVYPPALSMPGDQVRSSLAFGSQGGVIVWQDNTAGNAYIVRGRILAPDLSAGPGPFYLSSSLSGDQENPKVAVRADGTSAIVWQAGPAEHQLVKLRILDSSARFGNEIQVSGSSVNETTPVVAFLNGGAIVVAWRAETLGGASSQILAQVFDASGNAVGSVIPVNDYTSSPQRAPTIAALPNGGFAIAWISEQQSGAISSEVAVRVFNSAGTPSGPSATISSPAQNSDAPKLAALSTGSLLAVWSQVDPRTSDSWNVFSILLGSDGSQSGPALQVNTTQSGAQLSAEIASSGTEALVIWRSAGDSSNPSAILGQTLSSQGQPLGSEMILSAGKKGNQIYPSVSASASGQYLAVWSAYNGLAAGTDLFAQRLNRSAAPLTAMAAPYVYAQSATRLVVSWLGVEGQAVDHYDVFLDGGTTPVSTNGFSILTPAFAPSTTHTAAIRYVLADGRQSDLSATSSATTWGEDANADGLPDDWEAKYFGSDSDSWPSPTADPFGIGMTIRDAFFAGIDPTCKACALRVQVVKGADGLRVSWNSIPGRTYRLQTSSDLKSWSDYGEFALAVSTNTEVLLDSGAPGAYFRVNFIR